MLKCKTCGSNMTAYAKPDPKDASLLRVGVKLEEEDGLNMIISCLHDYWRWCAEGKPPYRGDKRNHDVSHTQTYYNPETARISYL